MQSRIRLGVIGDDADGVAAILQGLENASRISDCRDMAAHDLGIKVIDVAEEFIGCCTPENIHGVCEDYRAAAALGYLVVAIATGSGAGATLKVFALPE